MSHQPGYFHFNYPVPANRSAEVVDVVLSRPAPAPSCAQTQLPVMRTTIVDDDIQMDTEERVQALSRSRPALTTVNFDVQNHIMACLAPSEVSALMRTCHYFFDVGLIPLCARSKVPLRTPAQILSFQKFLRADSASSSRAPFIKDLVFSLEEYRSPLSKASYFHAQKVDSSSYFALPDAHPVMEEFLLHESRNLALEAFLYILQQCCNLRRLRVDQWYEDVPRTLLHHAISGLTALEDLRMPMFDRSLWGSSLTIDKLPLRQLVLRPGRWHEIPDALSVLQPLASTLVELDIPVCQWKAPSFPFPHLRKLSIEHPASEDVVSDLVRTFPNLTTLSLCGTRNFHLCHTHFARMEEDRLRERSQYQWHAQSDAWPLLAMISAETACVLYTLGLRRHVPRISVGYSTGDPTDSMLPVILTDARPSCLEIRVKQVHYKFNPLPRRFEGLKSGDSTSSLERVVLTMEGDGIPDYVKVSTLLVDELQRALSSLTVSHLLLKYSINHFRASRVHTRKVVQVICSQAPSRAAALAQAVTSLRWISIYVQVQGGPSWLYGWRISRLSKRMQELVAGINAPPPLTLTEVSEEEGWEVLLAEEMEEFTQAL